MKKTTIQTLIGVSISASFPVFAGSAMAAKEKTGEVGKSGKTWTAVCHQMTSPSGKDNGQILYVPGNAANAEPEGADHLGSIKPGKPGDGHDDGLWDPVAKTCDTGLPQ